MAANRIQFDQAFISNEVRRVESEYLPVRASFLTRHLVRRAKCADLHPNPEDEFCAPDIGPNDQIISNYMDQFKKTLRENGFRYLEEPVMVEKLHPDGYMLLNGHHRWAAALKMGYKKIPIRIINLPHEKDIIDIIEKSTHEMRVTLDLDEVVFCKTGDTQSEKPLPFPLNKIYRQRLRRGIPALFYFLSSNGFDIWVYSSEYYSIDYIEHLFRWYHVHVDGAITGLKKRNERSETAQRMKKLIANKYATTIHIDSDSIVRVNSASGQYDEYKLEASSDEWSQAVVTAVKKSGLLKSSASGLSVR